MSNEQTQIKPEAGAVVIANLVNEADGLQGMLVKVATSCFGGIGESVPAYKVYCYDMDAAQTVSVRSFRADVEGSLQKAHNFAQSFAACKL